MKRLLILLLALTVVLLSCSPRYAAPCGNDTKHNRTKFTK